MFFFKLLLVYARQLNSAPVFFTSSVVPTIALSLSHTINKTSQHFVNSDTSTYKYTLLELIEK